MFLYAAVALHADKILVDHAGAQGNFAVVAATILAKVNFGASSKAVYQQNEYMWTVLVQNDGRNVRLCESVGRPAPTRRARATHRAHVRVASQR